MPLTALRPVGDVEYGTRVPRRADHHEHLAGRTASAKVLAKTYVGESAPSFSSGSSNAPIPVQLGSAGLSSRVYGLISSLIGHWAAWR